MATAAATPSAALMSKRETEISPTPLAKNLGVNEMVDPRPPAAIVTNSVRRWFCPLDDSSPPTATAASVAR